MYVGVSLSHPHDACLMFNPSTKRFHISRDIVFAKKMFYREDFSVSSDQDRPLDTSFTNLQIIIDDSSSSPESSLNDNQHHVPPTPPQPATPPLIEEANEEEDETPSLTIRDDVSTVNSTTQSSINDNSTLSIFNDEGVFVLPDPPTPTEDNLSNHFDELHLMPDSPIPEYIDVAGPPTASDNDLDSSASPDERPFHTVTRRGRRIFTPERFRHQPESSSLIISPNPYSIFELDDEIDEDLEVESNPLYEAPPPPRISLRQSTYGIKYSGKTFSKFTSSMAKAMDFISTLSPPPAILPESALVGASGSAFHHTN